MGKAGTGQSAPSTLETNLKRNRTLTRLRGKILTHD